MQGSTDTTIYIIGMYFASIGIKKIRYSLVVGLLADLLSIIISLLVVTIYFSYQTEAPSHFCGYHFFQIHISYQ